MSNILAGSTNAEYHANRTHLSSSALKLLLKDIEKFHREYVLNIKQDEEEKNHLTEGTATHTLILENDKFATDYALYDGLRKQGANYQDFLKENPNKTILSKPQHARIQRYYEGYKRRPEAAKFITGGIAEHTILGNILDVPLKSRCDYINPDKGYIVDVKTTQYESGAENFKIAMADWQYDLSAALYCELAFQKYGKLFDFYFMVISKTDFECNIYKASSETLNRGRGLVNKALIKYKKALRTNCWTNEGQSAKLEQMGDYEIELI